MKRIITGICAAALVLFSMGAFADEGATVGDAMMKAIGGLEIVAAKVERMAPVAWEALIYAKVFDGISFLVMFCFAVTLCFALGKVCLVFYGKYDKSDADAELIVSITAGVIGCIAIIIAMVMAFAVPEAVRNILRPDVGVIKDMMGFIGGLK